MNPRCHLDCDFDALTQVQGVRQAISVTLVHFVQSVKKRLSTDRPPKIDSVKGKRGKIRRGVPTPD